ncbi:MAG TPA: two-component regulator propeller domain-containing protein, partial [Xanthomonadales bacterium]|nr:two-component regulator propeller domain-containing protein [Xanthomonadales bacterium]
MKRPAREGRRLALRLAAAVLALLPVLTGAHERAYYFERVSADEDLAQNTVNAILQDRTGFVWVATQGGLHRYDGYRFELFQHNPEDPGSLPDSFVTALAEDGDGRLWIGTNGSGIARFDAAGDRFTDGSPPTSPGQARGAIGALAWQAGRGLWIGSRTGIELMAPDGTRRDVLVFDAETGANPQVNELATARDGAVWAATSAGLYRIDPGSLQAQHVAPSLRNVFAVLIDSGGQVWAGSDAGAARVGAGGDATPAWPAADAAPEPRPAVYDIEQARDGRLWLAVYGGGVATLDPRSGAVERMRNDPRIPGSVPEDSVRTLMLDRSGLLWLGGDVHGVARTDPAGAKFRFLLDDDPTRPFVDSNNVRSLYEDQRRGLWIGTEGDGLKRYDQRAHTFEYFLDVLRDAMPAAERREPLRVFAIAPADVDGRLWISTNHGVFRLDPATRKATALPVDPARADALPDETVRSMLVGRDGSVWLGTFSAGLVRLQPESNRWTRFASVPGDEATLWHDAVLALHEDRLGRIWIGTFDGLNLLDPVSGLMRRIPRGGTDKHSLAGNLIRAIHESGDGTIWVGSHNGLSRLDELTPDGARFHRYLARDGLPNATVYAILEDGRGDLWISTNRGLTRFERDSERFRRFSLEDGLQGLEFNGGAALALADGRLAFGGSQGVNVFRPERMTLSDYEPRLAFTAVQLGDQKRTVLDPQGLQRLELRHDQRIIGLEFASLDFGAPSRNQFEYRLEGFDEGWHPNGTRRELTFTNLDPGQYTLHVRGTNRDQRWSPADLRLPIEVKPVWWASAPMKLVYALVALAAIAFPIAGQRRKVRREKEYTRELREREERLRVAIWGSGDEFWDWDIGRGVLFRIGADGLLGYEPEQQISGDDWRKRAVHPDDLPRVEQILAEHVAGQREFFESEHRIRNAAGEWVWVLSRGKIVERDPDG